ncbi:MAG: EndoU domain-containing protein, partial [Fusobacteriales bacterium]|nr:EndoU domain-containing protein [Fusobacteriales bacterium]
QGLSANIKKLENCKTAQCVADQTISVINISNGLTLTGVQAQKDIVQAKQKAPTCGKKCQASLKEKEEKLDKLYDITKEGYISLKQTEIDKLNNLESGKVVYEQVKNTDYLNKGFNSNGEYDTPEFREDLKNIGVSLIVTGHPAAIVVGGFLALPRGLDYLYDGTASFKSGDIYGGVQNLAGLASLGLITGISTQSKNTSLTQTTEKENSKLFSKDGIYILPNNTSLVGVSGNNVGRINYVNGVPSNYYGVIDGKLVMGNIGVESVSNQLFLNSYNGIASISVKYEVDTSALNHASLGDFTYNNKTGAVSKMKGGGHGQDNIDFLEKNGLEINIVKTYPNGVRIGNVPDHKTPSKRTGENQAWFPETWTNTDIKNAGDYVANLTGNTNSPDGVIMWGEYMGVRVGVIKTNGKLGTIFPDANIQPKK